MPAELKRLFEDLDLAKLRLRIPEKVIFLCGGRIGEDSEEITSLRQFLYRDVAIKKRVQAQVVLAEAANQIYRESGYKDLMAFEEDIARIASLVLLIVESPGSFAELGAFTAMPRIRRKLTILMQSQYAEAESFIRFGPVQRLLHENDEGFLVYPWETCASGLLNKGSIEPYAEDLLNSINQVVAKASVTVKSGEFGDENGILKFSIILWIVYISRAVWFEKIHEYANCIFSIDYQELRNKLYCLILVGWVKRKRFGSKQYYYTKYSTDPFDRYSFRHGTENDSVRRVSGVGASVNRDLKLSDAVLDFLLGETVVVP